AGAEVPRDRQRPREQLPPARATLDPVAEERGLVRGRGVEEEARSGFHDEREAEGVGEGGDSLDLDPDVRVEGIEMGVVEGEGAALVSELGDHPERVIEPVMGEAVRVVAVAERPRLHALANRRPSTYAGTKHAASSARKTRPVKPPGPHPRTNSATAMARSAAKPIAAARTRVTGAVMTSKRLTSVRMRT